MKLNKTHLDEVIRLTKKYFKLRDTDLLAALRVAEQTLQEENNVNYNIIQLIGNLAMFSQHSGIGTHKDIYKALAAFGIEVKNEIIKRN